MGSNITIRNPNRCTPPKNCASDYLNADSISTDPVTPKAKSEGRFIARKEGGISPTNYHRKDHPDGSWKSWNHFKGESGGDSYARTCGDVPGWWCGDGTPGKVILRRSNHNSYCATLNRSHVATQRLAIERFRHCGSAR